MSVLDRTRGVMVAVIVLIDEFMKQDPDNLEESFDALIRFTGKIQELYPDHPQARMNDDVQALEGTPETLAEVLQIVDHLLEDVAEKPERLEKAMASLRDQLGLKGVLS